MVFDDSFEHEVIHNGFQRRVVLLIDLWHPALASPRQREFVRSVADVLYAGGNKPEEK